MSRDPLGDGTFMLALDALERLEAEVLHGLGDSSHAHLAVARRVLRMQNLLLQRTLVFLNTRVMLTEEVSKLLADIKAVAGNASAPKRQLLPDTSEDTPVPGPTPNPPEDKQQG